MHTKLTPWARRGAAALLAVTLVVAAGCQSTRELLLAQGYPPAYAEGYEAGCGSGRQSVGALDRFRKNVPAYLQDRHYETGWDDGFRQCQASASYEIERRLRPESDADEAWRQQVDRQMGDALRRSRRQP